MIDWLRESLKQKVIVDGTVNLPAQDFDYVASGDAKFRISREIADFRRVEDNPWFRNIKDTDVCLDLGACVGAVTIPLAQKAKHVYAVEPLFHDDLTENINLNELKNVTVMPYGLGKSHNRQRAAFSGKTGFIDTMTFPEICQAINQPIDFLKVDVEGAEWEHLRPEQCEGIREVRIEFHVGVHRVEQDLEAIHYWLEWFAKYKYDVIEERGINLPRLSPFKYCYSLNASRRENIPIEDIKKAVAKNPPNRRKEGK